MSTNFIFFLFSSVLFLTGCVSDQVLTEKERLIQYRADTVVAESLFERELEETASYNVNKNGRVVILFDVSVPFDQYNEAVEHLRNHPDVNGVYAEQNGVEVCPLRL